MPIYEYACTECGVHIEKIQKTSDAPLEKCESCGGRLEKQVSLSGFQFKGEGWYVTDYAAKKTTDSPKSTESDSKKSDSDSTDSGDSASKEKPEKKAEPKKEAAPVKDKA